MPAEHPVAGRASGARGSASLDPPSGGGVAGRQAENAAVPRASSPLPAVLPPIAALERRVVELFTHWRVPAGAAVSVQWNARLHSTAGRAFGREGRIELNPTMLAAAPAELDVVLVHEAAHVAAHRLFGPNVQAHGRHWRGLMRLAGLPPNICHDLPVQQQRRRRSHLYLRVCDGCGARRIARVVRYDSCACGLANRFLVLRAPANEGGLVALREILLSEVRRRCGRGARASGAG